MVDELTDRRIIELVHDIRSGTLEGSFNISVRTFQVFREIIEHSQWRDAEELIDIMRAQCKMMRASLPRETVTSNMGRRILKIIREEHEQLYAANTLTNDYNGDSLHNDAQSVFALTTELAERSDSAKQLKAFRAALFAGLDEIDDELECSTESLCQQAETHVHTSECILTLGHSGNVEHFLRRAIQKREALTIMIAECSPENRGHELAARLASDRAEIVVIPDASIFSVLSRVNKVIMGTHSVLANGGLRAPCGAYTVALAAKHFSVPVFVLAPLYKLTSWHNCDQDASGVLESAELSPVPLSDSLAPYQCFVIKPLFDYVPPELITLFITNTTGYTRDCVYKHLSDLYHHDDINI